MNCIGLIGDLFGHSYRSMERIRTPPDLAEISAFIQDADCIYSEGDALDLIEMQTTVEYDVVCRRCGRRPDSKA